MIPIYRSDTYLRSLETALDSVVEDEGSQLVICHEALFAEGGGQPRDHGTLSVRGEKREVLELVKHKGDIRLRIHPIPELKKGDRVLCEIDFDRRYRIMRLHTAQHALAGSIRRVIGSYVTGGMQIDDEAQTCTMRFQTEHDFSKSTLHSALEIFQEIVGRGHAVHAEQIDSIDDAPAIFGEIFRPGDPAVRIKGRVRMVVIEGLDANACGGTHLKNTNEIGKLESIDIAPGANPGQHEVKFSLQ